MFLCSHIHSLCVLWLKKNLLIFLYSLTHTLFVFSRSKSFALSSLAISWKAATLYSLLLMLPPKRKSILFLSFSLCFTFYFPSPHKEDPWTKSIKFFVILSIYKILFIFPLRLRIYYISKKE